MCLLFVVEGFYIWWVLEYCFCDVGEGVVRVEDLGLFGYGGLMEEYQVWVYCQRKGESGDGS